MSEFQRITAYFALFVLFSCLGCSEPPNSESGSLPAKHIVQQSETLSTIARKYYGEEHTGWWQHIYVANKDLLKTPTKLSVGQVITVPEPPDPNSFQYEEDFSKL
jgi:phage tail protein X